MDLKQTEQRGGEAVQCSAVQCSAVRAQAHPSLVMHTPCCSLGTHTHTHTHPVSTRLRCSALHVSCHVMSCHVMCTQHMSTRAGARTQ